MRNVVLSGGILILAISVSGCVEAESAEPSLDSIRAATERFMDVNVALAAGYVPDVACVSATDAGLPASEGAMGIHYMRMDLLNISEQEPRVIGSGQNTDFLQPSILLYEPQMDGSLELVGIENVVFAEMWETRGNVGPPTFQGVAYEYMADDSLTTDVDEAHMFAPHYERHVWLYRDNPNGMYAQFNPNVTCDHFGHTM